MKGIQEKDGVRQRAVKTSLYINREKDAFHIRYRPSTQQVPTKPVESNKALGMRQEGMERLEFQAPKQAETCGCDPTDRRKRGGACAATCI